MQNLNYLNFIKKLISFSPRQLEGEQEAANFIIQFLEKNNFQYHLDYFFTFIPKIKKAFLKADNQFINCQGCSFIGGEIKDKDYLLSSLIPSRFFIDKSNINFNPKCPDISLSNFYFAPAIAISHKNLGFLLKAKKVYGKVKVEKIKHRSVNILVGNILNPVFIIFAHYDSIKKGAIDNASGVSVLASLLMKKEVINKNLFVFSGNEELSYDFPTYWGHGYRVFEKKYFKLLSKVKNILVVDCVGHSPLKIFKDENFIKLAFPIDNLKKFKNKILVLSGKNLDNLFRIYHSDLDDVKKIKEEYLKETEKKIFKII